MGIEIILSETPGSAILSKTKWSWMFPHEQDTLAAGKWLTIRISLVGSGAEDYIRFSSEKTEV